MASRPLSAGQRLRRDMDELLAAASESLECFGDDALEWSEQEAVALDAACAAADRSEALGRMFRTEQRKKDRHVTILVKLSAEQRSLDRQVVDLLAKINPGEGEAVSKRHQDAARARYGAQRPPLRGLPSR